MTQQGILNKRHRIVGRVHAHSGASIDAGGYRVIDGKRYLTTAAAARALGVSVRRIVALIGQEHLKATRFGRDWLIEPEDLEKIRDRRPGRPRVEDASTG